MVRVLSHAGIPRQQRHSVHTLERPAFLLPLPLMGARLGVAADERPLERTLEVGGGRIEVSVRGTPGQESAFWRWIDDAARAVSGYFDGFPVPRLRLAVRIVRGGRIGSGVTMPGAVPSISVAVGSDTTPTTFRRDWVLTHEMVHLAFPDLTSDDTWAEELGETSLVSPASPAASPKSPPESEHSPERRPALVSVSPGRLSRVLEPLH